LHDSTDVRTDDGIGIPVRAAFELPRQNRLLALFVSLCAALAVGLGALMWIRFQRSTSAGPATTEAAPMPEQASEMRAPMPPPPSGKPEVPVPEPVKEDVPVPEPSKADAPVPEPPPAPPVVAPPSQAEEATTRPKPKPTAASAVPPPLSSERAPGSGGKPVKKPETKPTAPTAAPAPPKVAPLFDF
jgi:hypothetical protein